MRKIIKNKIGDTKSIWGSQGEYLKRTKQTNKSYYSIKEV